MSKEVYNKIVTKLEHLDEYLGYLKDLQGVNEKVFTGDYHFFGLAERYFQLAIESILDVGKLVILDRQLPRPEDNQDIFVVLHDAGFLGDELADRLSGIANFRNILVHEYEKIDRKIVYSKLQKNLDDFFDFRKSVLRKIS